VGVFATLRKRALVADALAHATFPGIAMAFLLAGAVGVSVRSLPMLLGGAAISGVLGVLCIDLILRHRRLREDAAIGIVLSVFFGIGVVGFSWIQANAPAGSAGLEAFIFGHAATMRPQDLAVIAVLAAIAVTAAGLLLKEFAVVCFDEGFAAVAGWRIAAIDAAMMALVVLVVVAGLQAVGLVLVVALLIVPAVSARFWTERLGTMVVVAGAIGAASGYLGAVVSAAMPRQPAGAVVILASGAVFVASLLFAPSRGVLATAWRRLGLDLRIAGDHLLEYAHGRRLVRLDRSDIDRVARDHGWSGRLRRLLPSLMRRRGLVFAGADGALRITSAGRDRGARVARNHALWEQYLISHADIAPSHVDWSVDQVEHVLSEEIVRELEEALERDSVDRDVPGATR
ncbi:MAG: metal ABC transporter permease, partial [Planctomycetota bacterium]|jgi:manganese/zinc/iron transport system permease protein